MVNSRIDLHHKNRRKKRIIKRILLILSLFFLIIGGYFSYITFSVYQAANESYVELDRGNKSKLREKEVEILKDPISILLIGLETYSSGGADGRTDSLIVATLNPTDKSVKLLSIPRDTRVYIEEEEKKDKINHAYGAGGKEATINAVEQLLDIPIDYYATVNFDGFKYIIDEINGVTVEVPFDFWELTDGSNGKKRKVYFKEGPMTLNGEEALAYARMRKRDVRGDFGRGDRQKQIVIAAIDKLASPSTLFNIDDIAKHIGDNVETNISVSKALSLQKTYSGSSTSNIEQLTLEGLDDTISGIYYFIPHEEKLEELSQILKNHLASSSATTNQSFETNNQSTESINP